MKKIFTLAIGALLCVGASAKQLVCDLSALPASSENTTWDAATNTFAWSGPSYNSTQVFPAGDYSAYTTLNYVAEEGTADHFRIIFKFSNGSSQVTFNPAPMGTKSYTWAELGVSIDDVPFISTIRISGANDVVGDVKITSLYLEGPDVVTYDPIELYPQNGTSIKSLLTNAKFPQTFAVQGEFWGNNGTSTTGADISDYESLTFYVTQGSTGLGLRVWVSDGTSVATLYPYPEDQYETATFTDSYLIKTPGVYKVNLSGYSVLAGIKADNNWGASAIIVSYAYATPKDANEFAVDEARTLSSTKILDFSEVTDVEAYIATSAKDGVLTMKKVTGAVPANTGLVLKQVNEKSVISIPTCGTATEDVSGNLLVATTAPTQVPAGSYVLAGKGEDLGWYSVGASVPTLAAGKCYLTVPAAAAGSHFVMDFDSEEGLANSIEKVETTANGIFYTLQGAKVEAPQKGNIYVVNGKKVIY